MSELVWREDGPDHVTLTLNRPAVHNALDAALIEQLTLEISRAAAAQHARYIVLCGQGTSFCAGADLNWMRGALDADLATHQREAERLWDLLEQLARCPKPTVARVHGAALGGGLGLVAACDLAVATPDATFGLPETRLGLAPAVIMPFLLPKIGPGALRWAALLGQRFDATMALELGLINAVAADSVAVIETWGKAIGQAGPVALGRTKALIWQLSRSDWEGARQLTTRAIAELRRGEEGQRRMRAFLQRSVVGAQRR